MLTLVVKPKTKLLGNTVESYAIIYCHENDSSQISKMIQKTLPLCFYLATNNNSEAWMSNILLTMDTFYTISMFNNVPCFSAKRIHKRA